MAYGGRVLKDDSEKIRDYEEVIENNIGDNPENWVDNKEITIKEIYPSPQSHHGACV